MRLSMWKWLTTTLLVTNLYSASDKAILEFVEGNIKQNPNIELNDLSIVKRQPLETVPGWEAVVIKISVSMNRGGQKHAMTTNDVVFVSGDYLTSDLINMESRQSVKKLVKGKVRDEYYSKDRIIAGDKSGKAPNKLLVFSDPQCPFCLDFVPQVIALAKAHPKEISLYYVNFPLEMLHPSAPTIVRGILALELAGQEGVTEKVYEAKFDIRSSDENEVLKAFNQKMGSDLKPEAIHTEAVEKRLKADQEMATDLLVRGTPSLFINGEFDDDREGFNALKAKLSK